MMNLHDKVAKEVRELECKYTQVWSPNEEAYFDEGPYKGFYISAVESILIKKYSQKGLFDA